MRSVVERSPRRIARDYDPTAAMIALTIGFIWKLCAGATATRPPASSIAPATTGPTAAIVVRASAVRSASARPLAAGVGRQRLRSGEDIQFAVGKHPCVG